MKINIKKALKPILIILVAIVMFPFFTFGVLLLVVPISRSNEAVRNYVLRQIPMETNWDDTMKIIDEKNWAIEHTDLKHGLLIYDSAEAVEFATDYAMELREKAPSESRVAGVKAMFIELGEYYAPFHTAVFAYLAFDENNELIEVAIRRDIDSI